MNPIKMSVVIDGLRYDTEKAEIIAHNNYWDGSNWERSGRNTFLYRTPNNRYFSVNLTQWQGERDNLTPLTQAEALDLWEMLPEQIVDFETAFPGAVVEDA